jgi:hypothetical protein
MEDKVWTAGEIKEHLQVNKKWVERAVVAIYNKQTADEQASEATTKHNGVGFGKFDAKFLSSVAKSCIKFGGLTPRQLVHARKQILKYSGQLARIANGEI